MLVNHEQNEKLNPCLASTIYARRQRGSYLSPDWPWLAVGLSSYPSAETANCSALLNTTASIDSAPDRPSFVLTWPCNALNTRETQLRSVSSVLFKSKERELAYCRIWADACFAADKQAQSAGSETTTLATAAAAATAEENGGTETSHYCYMRDRRLSRCQILHATTDCKLPKAYNYQEQLIQNWNHCVVTVSVGNVVWVTVSAPQGRVAQWRRMLRPSALFSEAAASNLGSPPVS
ncbi:hypothetical protein T4D_3553 [Trichinella pseudospiralis]|uniref:Uncharacterized protein n=1 Tax=Trichinella pseudospiralis TaxID=6337 RepID=A0A0V1FJ36_TRIPS|nr:hypothetical protein T4D_3553 [Trichinella pseudospiralis]